MRNGPILLALALSLAPVTVQAAGPTVAFSLPAQDTTPAVFGSLPFPHDLYFDQGQPGDGDGTLLDTGLPSGSKMGLGAAVAQVNPAVVEDALDQLDGFGTTSAIYFFLDGSVDVASLPLSPVLTPALTDSVFCADTATATPVPITIKFGVDSRIPNVLAVQPLPGRPLSPATRYTCVIRRSVTGGGQPVEPSSDWVSVRDGASANTDADAICDPVVATLGTHGVPASQIAGMTVFTTESTIADLLAIRNAVLPGEPVPAADFTSRPELVFDTAAELTALLGPTPHAHVATVATGFFGSPRFQTHDPDGDGPLGDFPVPPTFASCLTPCETTDETFTHDGNGRPIVIDTPQIPVTVVIPSGPVPSGGWPVVIQQHGLGGQRDAVVTFGEAAAAHGFASIGIDAVAHGYRFFGCTPASPCSQDTANNFGGTAAPDGFADGQFAGLDLDVVTANLGFLQAFHNFLGVRDNLRQTQADLLSLVRLLHGHSVDAALGVPLDDRFIFYMGHSLGGLIGTTFVGLEADVKAALLDGAGGDFATRLFTNSPRAAGSLEVGIGVLGLDPNNQLDQYSFAFNLAQTVLDPADAANTAGLLLAPVDGAPRSVIQVEALDDEIVPNQASESLAVAGGLPLFDPFVQNTAPLALPVVGTQRQVQANVGGGLATAALVQTGFAAVESASTAPASPSLVPAFAHWDESAVTGERFPTLARSVRIAHAGVVDAAFTWFSNFGVSGPPGQFSYSGTPTYNPVQNLAVPAGASSERFFNRVVGQGGAFAGFESTPDVTVSFTSNVVPTRLTVARSTLGPTPIAVDEDVPPGPSSTVGTLGILPFHVTIQRELPGVFSADVTIAYSITELALASITPGSSDEAGLVVAAFDPGQCALGGASCEEDTDCGANGPCQGAGYTTLPTTVDVPHHAVTATGVTDFSTFAVLHPTALLTGFRTPLVTGGAGQVTDCRSEWEIVNPLNAPFLDRKGRVNSFQICHDGDVTCDADRTVNGVCHFQIAICFNFADPVIPTCVVGQDTTTGYMVSRPRPLARDPEASGDAKALIDSLTALGGVQGGLKQNIVSFTPGFANGRCTQMIDFKVSIRPGLLFGKQNIRGMSLFGSGAIDAGGDRLRLRCYRP